MSILSDAKELAELIKKYNDQEIYEKIVNLRDEIFCLREENLILKEKVKELENNFAIDKNLVRRGNYYVIEGDPNEDNKYCITCWDYERKLVGLIAGRNYRGSGTIKCNICASRFGN